MGRVELVERRLRNAATRTRLLLSPDPPALSREQALSAVASADRIIFLCLGNICRSPMAERYARARLAETGASVTVDSAGFVEREGRRSPPDAVAAAAARGVDLADHRSSSLSGRTLAAGDVVFVMDVRNYRDLARTFGSVDAGVYFLAPLAREDGRFEIPDPQGRGPEAFERAYDDVTAAVDALVAAVAAAQEAKPPAGGSTGAV